MMLEGPHFVQDFGFSELLNFILDKELDKEITQINNFEN